MPKLHVNGQLRDVDVEPETPLLWVLREQLSMTGTKYGCGVAQCGACSVHVNGELKRSCSIPVGTVADSDRIVTLFTEQLGKVSAIARSARRSQKRFAGGLESLCVVEVTLEHARGDLETLREARPVLPCLDLLTSLPRIEAAGAGLEMLRAILAERHAEPEVFERVVSFLLALDAGRSPGMELLTFQLDALDVLGFSPEFEQCGVCGKVAPEDRVALFRPSAGAIVCRACGGGAPPSCRRRPRSTRRSGSKTTGPTPSTTSPPARSPGTRPSASPPAPASPASTSPPSPSSTPPSRMPSM